MHDHPRRRVDKVSIMSHWSEYLRSKSRWDYLDTLYWHRSISASYFTIAVKTTLINLNSTNFPDSFYYDI